MKKIITLILLVVVGFGGFYLYSYNETVHDFCVNKVGPSFVNAWNWVVDLFNNTKVPEQPVDPEQPIEPNQPTDPETPTEPETPDKPTEPEQPIEPEQPQRIEMKIENSFNTGLNKNSLEYFGLSGYSENASSSSGAIIIYFKDALNGKYTINMFHKSSLNKCYESTYFFLGKKTTINKYQNNNYSNSVEFNNINYLIIPVMLGSYMEEFNLTYFYNNEWKDMEYEIVELYAKNNIDRHFSGDLLNLYNELNG